MPDVLGSRSTDQLAWLGPGRLQTGDRLGAGPVTGPLADHLRPGGAVDRDVAATGTAPRSSSGSLPGPHPDRFPSTVLDDLAAAAMTVDGAERPHRAAARRPGPPGARRAGVARHGHRRGPGAAGRAAGRPRARSRHARRLPGGGGRDHRRPLEARPVPAGRSGPVRAGDRDRAPSPPGWRSTDRWRPRSSVGTRPKPAEGFPRSAGEGPVPAAHVGAGFADALGDHPGPHEQREDPAAEAEAERRPRGTPHRRPGRRAPRRRAPQPAAAQTTNAAVVSTVPMAWAKRFGGPGVGRAANGSSGTTTRVASWPSGLNVGPVRTRAQKP